MSNPNGSPAAGADQVSEGGLSEKKLSRKSFSALKVWEQVFPFFLSAFLFLSAIFVVFAPLPLLVLYLKKGRAWGLLACASNLLLVFLLHGNQVEGVAIYSLFIFALVIPAAELFLLKKTLEWTVGVTFLLALSFVFMGLLFLAHISGRSPAAEFLFQMNQAVEMIAQVTSQTASVSASEKEELRQNLINEFPSGVGVFAFIVIWVNLTFALKLNPGGVRQNLGLEPDFIQNWQVPRWLIWPTLLCGVALVVNLDGLAGLSGISAGALGVFRVLMAVYAVQGISIVSFILGRWKVRGMWRALAFMILIFAALPLLLMIGFFDQWFDFRVKFRQKS